MISLRLFCLETKAIVSCHFGQRFRQYSVSLWLSARSSLTSFSTFSIVLSLKICAMPSPSQWRAVILFPCIATSWKRPAGQKTADTSAPRRNTGTVCAREWMLLVNANTGNKLNSPLEEWSKDGCPLRGGFGGLSRRRKCCLFRRTKRRLCEPKSSCSVLCGDHRREADRKLP